MPISPAPTRRGQIDQSFAAHMTKRYPCIVINHGSSRAMRSNHLVMHQTRIELSCLKQRGHPPCRNHALSRGRRSAFIWQHISTTSRHKPQKMPIVCKRRYFVRDYRLWFRDVLHEVRRPAGVLSMPRRAQVHGRGDQHRRYRPSLSTTSKVRRGCRNPTQSVPQHRTDHARQLLLKPEPESGPTAVAHVYHET